MSNDYTTNFGMVRTTSLTDYQDVSSSRFDDGWLPDKCTELINAEVAMAPAGKIDYESMAKQIMLENLPRVAASMVHIAMYDTNSATRLNAAKYLIDRVLGRDTTVVEDDPLAKVMEKLFAISASEE